MITHHRGSAVDLKIGARLAEGEAAQGRLEQILSARGDGIEVKSEPKCRDTGNVCVEFAQNDGRGGKRPSGIKTTRAEWWAIEFLTDRWLILPTETLLELARREYGIRGKPTPMGDNGNVGVLVPLASLIDPWMVPPAERISSQRAAA